MFSVCACGGGGGGGGGCRKPWKVSLGTRPQHSLLAVAGCIASSTANSLPS